MLWLLARLGAKVVVNDVGGGLNGGGPSATPAQKVVDEIEAAGGEAIASLVSVTNVAEIGRMVDDTLARWGRIDILVNNAGICATRPLARCHWKTFARLSRSI